MVMDIFGNHLEAVTKEVQTDADADEDDFDDIFWHNRQTDSNKV